MKICDAAAATKSTALGKAAIQKPERRLPGWLGQAGTDSDKAHKTACLPGGCMDLNCSKQQDLKQCGGIGPAQKIQRSANRSAALPNSVMIWQTVIL